MKQIWEIAKKEVMNYLNNPVGYIFAGLLYIVVNWLYFSDLFVFGQADLRPYWQTLGFLLGIFIPAVTMGLIAEEKRNGTWEVLLATPINEWQVVAGKYLGSLLYLLNCLALSGITVVIIYILGKPDTGMIIGGFLGMVMMTAAYLATGLFMSTISNQQIVAFISSSVLLMVNDLVGQESVTMRAGPVWGRVLAEMSLGNRMGKFSNGMIDIGDLVFFISWILIFLILSNLSLKIRDR